MSRYISSVISEMAFAEKKMVLLSGPRQVGKTFFGKGLLAERGAGGYYNWDEGAFRRRWARDPSSVIAELASLEPRPLIILDEVHKARLWKRSLKGVYDTLPAPVDILVTGSARLSIYQKGGDSLLGRYLPFRLHPFTIGEVCGTAINDPDDVAAQLRAGELPLSSAAAAECLTQLFAFGGFPEPFLRQDKRKALLWRRNRVERIIREDIRDLTRLPELGGIEMLASLLPERASQPLIRSALREDLGVAHSTVSRWLGALESLYYHFEVKPFQSKIKNSLRKEGKLYLWDYSEVEDEGARFENLVASHLLKACHYWSDGGYGTFSLNYLRTKSGAEIDFLVTRDKKPFIAVEVKLTDTTLSRHWSHFLSQLPGLVASFQVVATPGVARYYDVSGVSVGVVSAERLLGML